MRLRKQLFFVSLFTLALPWVGCQYVQEMEETLLDGQAEALRSTALAVAATIEADDSLTQPLTQFSAPGNRHGLYLHPFDSPLILDGYSGDWQSYGYQPRSFKNLKGGEQSARVLSGLRDKQIWLHFKVPSGPVAYFNPGQSSSAAHRINLTVIDAAGALHRRTIVASSQGRSQNFIASNTTPDRLIDHSISGIWRESSEGFTVELRLPLALAASGLGFAIHAPNDAKPTYANIANSSTNTTAPRPSLQSEELAKSLSIFRRQGIRLSLASTHRARVAFDGQLAGLKDEQEPPWVLNMMFNLALGDTRYPALPSPSRDGYFSQKEVLESLADRLQSARYSMNSQTISSVSVPIKTEQGVIGAVLAEQNARSLSGFTNQAFSRLLFYSIIVSFGSALILVLYASWLSVRIRSLSKSASGAISDTGKVSEHFLSSSINDEVGDLSRSFAQLLSRLKEYTDYLKTLSSKLSHELRTPLAIVSSSLDNLEHENLPAQAEVYAQRAKEGTARLSNILNAMNAASRVEQAISGASLKHIPLDSMLTELHTAYADVYRDTRIELSIQSHESGFGLLASPELLVQMLDKLVDNAADFCPAHGAIEIGLKRQESELLVTVKNDGPLLPETMHNQLFDSMVSLRDSTASKAPDTHHLGLGLYIVRLIVDFHQGRANAYNLADSRGVIFEIHLPSPVSA